MKKMMIVMVMVLGLLLMCLVNTSSAWRASLGDSKESVKTSQGMPEKVTFRGTSEIWFYPSNVPAYVEVYLFENGKVVQMSIWTRQPINGKVRLIASKPLLKED